MDSGNSGSMQSSSGDEEFDSRAESISAFLNNNNNSPLTHVGPMPNPPPPQPPPRPDHQYHHHSSLFDSLSNYFDPLSSSSSSSRPPPPLTNPNSLLNLDMVWSKNLRSDPNCTDLGGFVPSTSPTHQFFTNQTQTGTTTTFPPMQILHEPDTAGTTTTKGSGSGPGFVSGSNINDQTNSNGNSNSNMVRNPKKRSRASRRAPTTVLTTDTTNFRAMVQEFTGIPAPPFTSSPFPRTRLDLFGTAAASTLRSAATNHLVDPSPPPYLLRPFAQKIQPQPPQPFVSPPPSASTTTSTSFSTSLVDAMANSTTTTANINSNATTNNSTTNSSSASVNYQLPSPHDHLGLLKQQPQNLLNINLQNPILNFHSLLQPPPKYPLPNSSTILSATTKPTQAAAAGSLGMASNDHSHLKMGGVLEDFGLSHGHVSTNLTGLQNIVSSSDHHQGLLRSINGGGSGGGNYNNSSQRGATTANGKLNYSPSSSDFIGDKGTENVAARSEGMMESWICSSD